ncbi:MAG: 6,7-dimethyl-8-ribityllumazine synthase [Phycisphaerales bacterium]
MHDHRPHHESAAALRIAVAVSSYHSPVTLALLDGARAAFSEAGGAEEDLIVMQAPGAFELPVICAALLARDDVDAVVALGCILAGETTHDQVLGNAVATSLINLSTAWRKPVGLGLLTCQTIEQAQARAGGPLGNKGAEAMQAAISTSCVLAQVARNSDLQANHVEAVH